MDIRELRCFTEVVRHNGFGRAAEALHLTQPAVSRNIQRLETQLGKTLLIRDPHGISLTSDGEILLRHAQLILCQFNNLFSEIQDSSPVLSGELRVGLPPVVGSSYFADIIMAFRSRFPAVELKIIELGSNQMAEALQTGRVETAAVMLPFDGEQFSLQPFARDQLFLLAAKQHSLASRQTVRIKELLHEAFIFFAEEFRINNLINSACGLYGVKPVVAGRTSHLDLMMAMVHAGVGITLLPRSVRISNLSEDFVAIPLTDPELSYELALVRCKAQYQSRSCHQWNQLAAEMLGITPASSSDPLRNEPRATA